MRAMYRKPHCGGTGLSAASGRRHAVVVGGSMAGMLAARALADHFDAVTLLERDRFPETPAARTGLPQGRHAHALLERGRRIVERFLPGLTGELVRAGAELMDFTRDFAWLAPSGWYLRVPSDLPMLACSRDLIDWGVRARVAELPNVRVRQRVAIAGLVRGPDGGARVAGVRLRSRTADDEVDLGGEVLATDLVVVADGRHSRLPEWLSELGYEPPEETVVNSFHGYASRSYRRPAGFAPDWKALYIQQAPPSDPRGGIVQPVEGGAGWSRSSAATATTRPPTMLASSRSPGACAARRCTRRWRRPSR
jgi:2-polyprenyl-6-methoxyphenol hydroxylase-like FAD-dependent oxidoreductase